MADSVSSFGMTHLLEPDAPPVPVASAFFEPSGDWLVVFDKPLVSGDKTTAGWTIIINAQVRGLQAPVVVDGNVVSGTTFTVGPAPVSNRIVYNSAAGTLVGLNGKLVESFLVVPSVNIPVPESALYTISENSVTVIFSEDIFINTATKNDFVVVASPNILTVQSISVSGGNRLNMAINVDGPGGEPDRVEYNGRVDGIEDSSGNDVPLFIIGLDIEP